MTNIAHASLTGANLHEPKGVASATNGQVYVSNGSGTGVWTDVTSLVTSPSQNSFAQVLHARRESPAPLALGSLTWTNSALTTVVYNNISGASIGTGYINLPAGNYFTYLTFPFYRSGKATIRLFNLNSSSVILNGGNAYSGTSSDVISRAELHGRFTLPGLNSVIIQHLTESGGATDYTSGVGVGNEVHYEVLFWKLP